MSLAKTRDELLEVVRVLGGRARTLSVSQAAAGNLQLSQCMTGIDGTDCASFQWYPVYLHATPDEAVTGTETDPKYFDPNGRSCAKTEPAQNCPISLWTRFRAQCKPDMTSSTPSMVPPEKCPGATPEVFEILYRIGLRQDAPQLAERMILSELYGSIMVEP
jgi:hypothetical protein